MAFLNYEIVPGVVPEDILLIHGNLASNRWWQPAVEAWRRNARGRALGGSLILAEFRGCGKSPAPRSEAEVDMRVFARDYLALLKDLGRGPVHVVGHSTGGLIATLMMALQPSMIKKAVLLDPVGARGVTFDASMIGAFERMKTDRDLVSVVMNSTIKDNDPSSEFFQKVIVEDAFSAVKTVGHLVLKALDGLDIRQEASEISHPVLVLHGEHDAILPLADARELAEILCNGTFEILAGRGHCANVEDPKTFVERTDRFLDTTH